jgi:AcrR family transcriptional regulator
MYAAGEAIDMSALATRLNIGRATLYRWVGNREELLAEVLAGATERSFRAAEGAAQGHGVNRTVDVFERFMRAVLSNPGLVALTQREPLVFVRLATSPGAIEDTASALVQGWLTQEQAAGQLTLPLPASALATAIVRICDVQMYRHLLGRGDPDIETALDTVRLLLGGDR